MRSLSSSLSFCHLHSSPPVPALPLLLSSRAVPVGRSQPGRAWLFLLNSVSSSFFLSSGPAVSEPASLFLLHPICLHVLGVYSLLVSECTSRQPALHPHCAHPQTCKHTHTHTYLNMHMHSVAYVMLYRAIWGRGRSGNAHASQLLGMEKVICLQPHMFWALHGNTHMPVMSRWAGLHRCIVRGIFLLMCRMTLDQTPQNEARVELTREKILDPRA